MRINKRFLTCAFVVAFLAVLLSTASEVHAQCAMCREALTQSPEGQRWARGIDHGIYVLLAAPLLIVGTIVLMIFPPDFAAFFSRIRARISARRFAFSRSDNGFD